MNKKQIIIIIVFGIFLFAGIFLLVDHFRVYPPGTHAMIYTVNVHTGERGGYGVDTTRPYLIVLKWLLVYFLPVTIIGILLFNKFKNKS